MNKKGFTLVEVLAVIVVLGLIVSISLPIYIGLSNNLKKNTYENKKRAIESAATKYAAENNINTTTKFTATKLIIDNYYQAEKYVGDTPWIDNPLDVNDNLACHIVEIKVENYEYSSTVLDDSECDMSFDEIEDSKIKIYAYNLGSGEVLGSAICTNCPNELQWTNNNVLIGVIVDDSVLKNYTSISYTIGGNSKTKQRSSGNEFRSFSSYANKKVNIDDFVNLYKVDATLILNQQLSISLDTTDGIKTKNVTVKIDKEKPIFALDEEDTNAVNKESASIYVTDGNGSGIKEVKYIRASDYNANHNATKYTAVISNIGNGNVRATLNQRMRNETYYLWATDNVGNTTDNYNFEVQGIREFYIIKYDGNGGTVSKEEDRVKKGEYLTSLPTADKGEEWKFLGWYTEKEGGTKVTTSYKITDDMTLHAHWEKYPVCYYKKYSYNKNWLGEYRCVNVNAKIDSCFKRSNSKYCDGGTGNYAKTFMCTANSSYTYNNEVYCNSTITSSSYGGSLPSTESCKCQNVTVSYNLNGGNGSPADETVNYGSVLEHMPTSNNVYKTGYTFAGWYTSASGGERVDQFTQITRSMTLYAHWDIIRYDLEINYNGGSYSGYSSRYITRDYNTVYTPDRPTRAGYTFNGWTHSGSGSWNGTQFTFTGNSTLKANWKQEYYRINYEAYTDSCNPDGTCEIIDREYGYVNKSYDEITYGSYAGVRVIPYSGYTVTNSYCTSGYSMSENLVSDVNNQSQSYTSYVYNNNYAGSGTCTYVFGPASYPVTLHNYDNSTKTITARYDRTLPYVTPPSRYGYTFNGYFTSSDSSGTRYYYSSGYGSRDYNYTYGIDLYAGWDRATFTLTYNNNGGSGCSSTTRQFGDNWGYLCRPSRSGYTFTGWSGAYDYMEVSGNVTATAQWKQNEVLNCVVTRSNNGYTARYNCRYHQGYFIDGSCQYHGNTTRDQECCFYSSSRETSPGQDCGQGYYYVSGGGMSDYLDWCSC